MKMRNIKIKTHKIKSHKKKSFYKRKPKKTVKRNKATRTRKRKIVKGGEKRKERENECPICYEELNNPDNPDITLSCDHTFHRNCMINTCRHMRGRCTCPYCRGELTDADLDNLGIAQPQPQPQPQDPAQILQLPPQHPPQIFQVPPRDPPSLETIDEFRIYINNKLRAPTRTPLEKLENELDKFIGTDSLPVELFEDVAMEFELQQIGPAAFHRYRFIRIIDLQDIPPDRLNKKYVRFIDLWNGNQLENPHYYEENPSDYEDQDMIIAYDVFEVPLNVFEVPV
jgi:hypothetical protein